MKVVEGETQLRATITSLPTGQADVLRLAYCENPTHVEIEEGLSVFLGSIKSRIRSAVAYL